MVQHFDDTTLPSWEELDRLVKQTTRGRFMQEQEMLREEGEGLPHTDAKVRRFGTTGEPRVTLYRDSAAWCPYCQKVWILLEEKRIPYKVEKVNMRCYGDKPQSFLRLVPSGAVPAITLDGHVQTESLDIMMLLEKEFNGPKHRRLWPDIKDHEHSRARELMRLERDLFSRWWNLVFRPSRGEALKSFENGLDEVNRELMVTSAPWFLSDLSIVDLSFIPFLERMCASVAYWSGFKIRGNGRWLAIERWFDAFESLPSYMATKSDYYTHIKDLPPQCGRPYTMPGHETLARQIDGSDNSWTLPLPPFSPSDVQPVSPAIDPGEESARHEAAYKLIANNKGVVKFALRGAGSPGKKTFGAPLADPDAEPNLTYLKDMDSCLRLLSAVLLKGAEEGVRLQKLVELENIDRLNLIKSAAYLRDRVGVPRDMSYPAARQLRARLNWLIDQINSL